MSLIFDNILAKGKQRTILFLFALLFMLAPQVCAQSQQMGYETILEKAHRATRLNNLSEAESLFRQVLRDYPQDYRNSLVLGNLGRVQEMMGKDVEAMDSYTSALKLSPQSVPLLEARAALYLRLGNLSKAVADYTTIIDREPGNLQALSYRAYAHSKQRNYIEAKQDYDKVLKIDARNYAAQLGMAALCVETGKTSEALSRLDLLVGQYPDKAEIYALRADILKTNGRLELALMDLDKAVELEPDNADLVLVRAYLHLELGNKFYAKRDFEKAVSLGVPRSSLKEELRQVR